MRPPPGPRSTPLPRSLPPPGSPPPPRSRPALLTVYSAPACHLCQEALAILRPLSIELGFELVERDITLDDALHRAYLERIPVVDLDGEELFEYFVDADLLRERLRDEAASGGPSSPGTRPGVGRDP